jgi:hypothetical protein
MITVKGKIENGKVLALEPIGAELEGLEVVISVEEQENGTNGSSLSGEKRVHWQYMMEAIQESIDEDTTDLAHQHDYYLYGTPKRED